MVTEPPAIISSDLPTCLNCNRPCRPDRKHCRACEERMHRGVPLSRPIRPYGTSRWERLVEAAVAYANVPAEADKATVRRHRARLRIAALRYASKRR